MHRIDPFHFYVFKHTKTRIKFPEIVFVETWANCIFLVCRSIASNGNALVVVYYAFAYDLSCLDFFERQKLELIQLNRI